MRPRPLLLTLSLTLSLLAPFARPLAQEPAPEARRARMKDGESIPYELLQAGKLEEALAAYRRIKQESPSNAAVSEGRLNTLGYELLGAKKLREAVAVLALNAELHPQSFNVYDSLAEAYAASGEKELAIKNYRKSLELNPENDNAGRMLKKLEGPKQ